MHIFNIIQIKWRLVNAPPRILSPNAPSHGVTKRAHWPIGSYLYSIFFFLLCHSLWFVANHNWCTMWRTPIPIRNGNTLYDNAQKCILCATDCYVCARTIESCFALFGDARDVAPRFGDGATMMRWWWNRFVGSLFVRQLMAHELHVAHHYYGQSEGKFDWG